MDNNINIEERAKAYAQEALKEQLDAVANAYIQGWNDAMAQQIHEPIREGKDRFCDLGLDSGTMWTWRPHFEEGRFKRVGYYDALKYGIPTVEQFEEMFNRCRPSSNYTFLAPSSASLDFSYGTEEKKYVWVQSDVVNDEALACRIHSNGTYEFKRLFTGEALYIMRVKNKNEVE